eukprot:Tbor_TRINITY_DN4491_c0_g1::TRINITY_DN4491_c0_g1_i1::g.7926::m.7926
MPTPLPLSYYGCDQYQEWTRFNGDNFRNDKLHKFVMIRSSTVSLWGINGVLLRRSFSTISHCIMKDVYDIYQSLGGISLETKQQRHSGKRSSGQSQLNPTHIHPYTTVLEADEAALECPNAYCQSKVKKV